ncbi:MAG: hypothetical protein ACAH83_05460 [Alphaproteobacteria bacterium]
MKVSFHFAGPQILSRIERLRRGRPAGQFLKQCLLTGLALAEKRDLNTVRLERARPGFEALDFAAVAEALQDTSRVNPVGLEVRRLARLYAPALLPRTRTLKPSGKLRLDVRCPIEKVAADLAFRAGATECSAPQHRDTLTKFVMSFLFFRNT